MISPHFYW